MITPGKKKEGQQNQTVGSQDPAVGEKKLFIPQLLQKVRRGSISELQFVLP